MSGRGSTKDSSSSQGGRSDAQSTPMATYHPMDAVVVEGTKDKIRLSSPNVDDFGCRFDPSLRHGSALVLRFDKEGNASMEEMSRFELLRMTQEAATADPAGSTTGVPSAPKSQQSSQRSRTTQQSSYATICDVQRVHARDIRKLDNAFSVSNEPSIELRNQAIMINADPIRAIVMRHSCYMFVPDGADSLLLFLKENFRDIMSQDLLGNVSYEFRALEAVLATLGQYFKTEFNKISPVVSSTLDRLASGVFEAGELEVIRGFKNTMREFESQVDGVRRALMDILDNEEDLRLLYLTKLYKDPNLLNDLWSFDSEEAEVLIENYLQDIVSTRTKAALMQHRIQSTESLVMMKLDSVRNYLLGIDILFSIIAISLSVGTFVAGIFGMNLSSGVEDADGWFRGVIIGSVALMIVISVLGYLFFRRKGVFL